MRSLIEIKDLTFGYGKHPVLENVSLNVDRGDFLLIIGPNGGGKTTLLKIIMGIIRPWGGTVNFPQDLAGKIGYVPQASGFNRDFPITLYETVRMGLLNRQNYLRRYTPEDGERALAMLKKVNLYEKRHAKVNSLSGGELQRTLIARALVSRPLVLLLDEPTASIDITSQTTLLDLFEELKKEMTILVVTHDPTAFTVSYKRIACLNRQLYLHDREELDGKMLEQIYGCPVELLGHGIPHTLLQKHGEAS